MAKAGNSVKQRVRIWWKFKYPLWVGLLTGVIAGVFSLTDVKLASVAVNSAPEASVAIGSVLQNTASFLPVLDNISRSEFGVAFWIITFSVGFTVWILLTGLEVLFGKKGEVYSR